jgi:peptidoglycan hydrolase-like protein with peptidoglycan-binding domain
MGADQRVRRPRTDLSDLGRHACAQHRRLVPSSSGGGILANIQDHGSLRVVPGTTCSPFTGTVVGLAFDPTYPRNDLPAPSKGNPGGDAYKPMFNGGKDPLPWKSFYIQHNNDNQPIESIVKYGLGVEKKPTEMRRGDVLGIGWFDKNRGGHAVFCWDVHLDENGDVDAFQYLGANSSPWWCGVTIGGCAYKPWIKGNPKMDRKQGLPAIENARPGEPVFKDEDLVVQKGQWLVLPGVSAGSVKPDTFRVTPSVISYPKDGTFTVHKIRVARLNYDGSPPEPYCMKEGGATAMQGKIAQVAAPLARQDPAKALSSQQEVENALRHFYAMKWIKSDPGSADAINDAQSKKAIKEYQALFKLDVDGIVGKQTLASVRKQLPACLQQAMSEVLLMELYKAKKIKNDPGSPDMTNDAKTQAAVKEFQEANGLLKTGVPDMDTIVKLGQVLEAAKR